MTIVEPQRGHSLLITLNTTVANSHILKTLVPILADIFVFSYPILLVVWYIIGMIKSSHDHKSDSLTVLFGAGYVTVINMILQNLFYKDRPIFSGDSAINLILNELPTAAFPSDHAAVSMVIGLMVLLIAFRCKNSLLKSIGIGLVICSIIMSVSRVAVGVHRPTDILAGWCVAVVVALVLQIPVIKYLQHTYINSNLIKLQEWILALFNKNKK